MEKLKAYLCYSSVLVCVFLFGGLLYAAFDGSDNVTVYGYRNTAVEAKMKTYDIPFVPLDPEEIEEMVKEADQDNDGQIDYDEFVKMMMSK